MGRPSRHIRQVPTKNGLRATLINDDVDPKSKASSTPARKEKALLRDAATQLADGGGTRLERKFVGALASQGDGLSNRSYGMIEAGDLFASGRISREECLERVRATCVNMETSMAAIEYAASRLSPSFQSDVAEAHGSLRESAADALGYLIDMDDEASFYGEKTARGFRDGVAQTVFDRSKSSALVIREAAQRETVSHAY